MKERISWQSREKGKEGREGVERRREDRGRKGKSGGRTSGEGRGGLGQARWPQHSRYLTSVREPATRCTCDTTINKPQTKTCCTRHPTGNVICSSLCGAVPEWQMEESWLPSHQGQHTHDTPREGSTPARHTNTHLKVLCQHDYSERSTRVKHKPVERLDFQEYLHHCGGSHKDQQSP